MRNELHWLLGAAMIGACATDPSVASDEEATTLAAETSGTCGDVDRSAIWKPEKGATWDLQLSGTVNTSANVDVYDIDADNSAALIEQLHRAGRKVICYVNVGAWEPYRKDSKKFPAEVLGNPWSKDKYADEKWLDVRRIDVIGPLMEARFDAAKEKGCDGIDADNVDGFDDAGTGGDRTGFDLTHKDQLAFNRYIACAAHERGLAIGLKNNPSQAAELQQDFDFVVSEQCVQYNECKWFQPFLTADKPVFLAEYRGDLGANAEVKFQSTVCKQADQLGISAILKTDELNAWRVACPSESGPSVVGSTRDAGTSSARDAGTSSSSRSAGSSSTRDAGTSSARDAGTSSSSRSGSASSARDAGASASRDAGARTSSTSSTRDAGTRSSGRDAGARWPTAWR